MLAQGFIGAICAVANADPKPTSLIPPAISPARDSEKYRVKQTGTRLTEAEFAEVEAAATDEGTNISAWIFTNDREKLPQTLGHDASQQSAHTPERKPPQPELAEAPRQEKTQGMDMGLSL